MKEKLPWFTILSFILILILTSPIIIGFIWLFISTFSHNTHGLIPIDKEGNFGGFTLENWYFISNPKIWIVTFNTLILATGMTLGVLVISASAGYSLARIKFPGRRGILSLTLVLHAFPSITLLIAIFFVLRFISGIPLIGKLIGYNSLGGVILVSLALQLPLGIWLMKGFFDSVSWDLERAALIDGCSRFRTWWQIIVPQIKPGLAALGIFSFMTGWSSFLIPYTFMVDGSGAVISTYLNEMISSDTAAIPYGTLAAVGLFQLLPIMIFYIFTQKYLMKIFSGGSKGA